MKRALIILSSALLCMSWAKSQPGFGPPGGGFGPPMRQERKVLAEFDKNKDGWLNKDERSLARESFKQNANMFRPGGPGRGPGGPGGFGIETGKPGPKVKADDVKNYDSSTPFYAANALRTIFLEFENPDWEKELEDFHNTDVEVPATLIVDGKKYPNVGVKFRGNSSYMMVPSGSKRSLNLAMDLADSKQRLMGYKTLNLLNAHEDSTFLSSILYSQIARQYMPTPQANAVRVVINGESWGVYSNVQQFDKIFLNEHFKTTKGTRWKAPGNPMGGSGLEYIGDKVEDYKRRYEMKSGDGTDEKAWKALIELCKVLNTTPANQLEEKLKPLVDIDELLWFLALDNVLINNDGYWTRGSDFSIYLDPKGKFHFIPHDMNEAFRQPMGGPGGPGGGPGGRGGFMPFPPPGTILPQPIADNLELTTEQKAELAKLQKETDDRLAKILTPAQRRQLESMKNPPMPNPGGFGPGPVGPGPGGFGPGMGGSPTRGVELDPLINITDSRKPLRSKVLAVPAWKKKYLDNVRTIAEKSLDWKSLGPIVASYRKLLDAEIKADTRKLSSYDAFVRTTADDATTSRGRDMPLRAFADQRRKYLLDYQTGNKK